MSTTCCPPPPAGQLHDKHYRLAALDVFRTGAGWPHVAVVSIMGALALQGAWHVVSQACHELTEV